MAVITPAYRLRVYAPRSTDATEVTLLTPAAGAPHAEAFRVATIPGVLGYRAYLFPPMGRRGRFDPLTKRVDTGEMTFQVFDKRVDAGTNAQRWLSAFTGDVDGRPAMLNCRAEVDESLDGGVTWPRFFTGRVEAFEFGDVLVGSVTLRESAELFDDLVFTGRPQTAVAYAAPAAVLPVQATPPTGSLARTLPGIAYNNADTLHRIMLGSEATTRRGNGLSTALASLADRQYEFGYSANSSPKGYFLGFGVITYPSGNYAQPILTGSKLRALVTWSGGSGQYPVREILSMRSKDNALFRPEEIQLGIYPVTDPGYAVRPPDATAVKVTLVADSGATAEAPIILENVSPLTFWQDLLAGKFSRLNADGSVRRPLAVDAAAFTALAAARSFLPLNAVITKPLTLRSAVEDFVLRPYHLGYRVAPDGTVVPFDCRRDPALATATGLGVSALADPGRGFAWSQQRSDAVSNIRVEAFRDSVSDVEERVAAAQDSRIVAAAGAITSGPLTIFDVDLSARAVDVAGDELVITAPGWRSRVTGTGKSTATGAGVGDATLKQEEAIIAAALVLAGQLRSLYGAGSTRLQRTFRRTSAGDVLPGMWRRLTIDEAPNASTNTRGGERLALCVDRLEAGVNVQLEFIDGGSSSVAAVPALASLAISSAGAPTVTVTRNAAGDPVVLQVVLSSQAVGTAPTVGWLDAGVALVTGVFTLPTAPAGLRLWVRGRSEPQSSGDDFRLPSANVSPAPAYIDTGSVTAPSAVAVSGITLSTALASWTVGDATAAVEVLVSTGSYSAGLFDDEGLLVARLPAGSTSYRLTGLNGPSLAHCVGVRHVQSSTGRFSLVATANFTTLTADTALARPAGLCIASPVT